MQYLVKLEFVETDALLASQQIAQLMEHAVVPTLEACAKLEAEKKILAGGVAAGSGTGTLIIEAGSNEELNQLVQSLPAWGALKVTVTPLQSFAERVEQDRRRLEDFKASPVGSAHERHEHLGKLRDLAGK